MAVEAPGPVVLTSNKRDVHDATRDVRARTGHVWAFDPNDKLGLRQDFWFDLPGEITSIDVAREVASHFAMGDRAADARTDAYFDKEGETLLARLLLATARGQATLSDTFRWVQNPYDRTPVDLLTRSGDLLSAEALEAQAELPDKQREGVYGTARSFLSCLENPDILRWVTPPKHTLPRFIASDFVASTDTLHSLSEEGEGSAGPLVAALTTAVFNAGRRRASRSPSGRLDPPCLSILDEAANVVRLRRLPALYSHFGSQGLPTVTVLQSWSQGVGVWGEAGMKALWGAATVRIYGGGGADPAWLHDLSQMVGTYDRPKTSLSTGRGGTNVNHDATDRPIYPVSDLASLPAGRAVAFISQHRPMLLRTRPWMTGPYANDIRDSLARWDPQPSL
ncbi:TraM-binding TraD/TraG-like protein [Prauserella marina]|nr:type IV secretory system conjugative DNA transfer family protein [Prauserella marina]PWV71285.1 TraM-binding TraD/TraG-like protein [Prauserella marina]